MDNFTDANWCDANFREKEILEFKVIAETSYKKAKGL